MHNLPVHWHEGLFLRPHHLQAAERWYGETLTTSERYDHTYNYGVSRLEINEEAVANGQFQIDACHARSTPLASSVNPVSITKLSVRAAWIENHVVPPSSDPSNAADTPANVAPERVIVMRGYPRVGMDTTLVADVILPTNGEVG